MFWPVHMLRQLFVLLAVACVTLAFSDDVIRVPLEEKPEEYENCDGCWVSKLQQFIPLGKSITSPQCEQYSCRATEVLILTCLPVGTTQPPCYITKPDLSKLYPDCCAKEDCPLQLHGTSMI